ncbi:hypothetical protein PVAG01_04423 [Phlyctema vagabunda]|uniref:Uncharacterized protein n=1 Tax=Phlyctema vagabunda TaxID=108571 RepID=A0ABR4PP59_9HELO
MKLSIVAFQLLAVIRGGFAIPENHAQMLLDVSERFDIPLQNGGESYWRRLSNLEVIPLHSKARTGLIPIAIEEGLISALGPRFANVFIEDALRHGTCWSTFANDMIQAVPCFLAAMLAMDSSILLQCGLDATSICKTLECLPSNHYDFVSSFCNHDRHLLVNQRATDMKYNYVDTKTYVLKHGPLAGWRGDIHKDKHDFDIAQCLDCDQLNLKCCGGGGCAPNGMCMGQCC